MFGSLLAVTFDCIAVEAVKYEAGESVGYQDDPAPAIDPTTIAIGVVSGNFRTSAAACGACVSADVTCRLLPRSRSSRGPFAAITITSGKSGQIARRG